MTHQVVVIGAGYAGIPAARRLARSLDARDAHVILVNAFPDFVERPRLHQVAAGQPVTPLPLASLMRGSGVELLVASVVRLDLEDRRIEVVHRDGRGGSVAYDTLVYALGSNIDAASVAGAAEHCSTLMGTSSAVRLRSQLSELERGAGTVVVCGGGLTGIEIATEIADAHPRLRTQLVSARPPGGWMSPRARDYLDSTFDTLGVDVLDGVRVERVDPGGLVGTDGVTRPFDLCVWATGFTVPDLARTSGLAVAPNGRALVDATLRSISHPDVYVIGDAAAVAGTWGTQLAMGCRSGGLTAPAVADVITARLSGAEPRPFRYRYFHECVSLGRRRGLVQFLAEDETPKDRVLTGRKALWYKDIVLHAARVYLRHPGPYTLRRRRRRPPSAIASSPGSRRGA